MAAAPDEIRDRLREWFGRRMDGARSVEVSDLHRLAVGFSNDTFAVDVRWDGADGPHAQTFVLRTAPPPPGLLEPYDLSKQFNIMRCLKGSRVPVPEVYWFEVSEEIFGRPFFAMERIEGSIVQFTIPEYVQRGGIDLRRRMGDGLVDHLAEIHLLDWEAAGLGFLGDGRNSLDRELSWWESEMQRVRLGPLPAFEAVAAWLRDNLPEPVARRSLVHGDPKWGNFMFYGDSVAAVLDWEMATVGDPMLDVAYHAVTSYLGRPDGPLPGSLVREEFIARYEQQTGMVVPDLLWYEVMQAFKLAVIMLIGYTLFEGGRSRDLRFAPMGAQISRWIEPALRRIGFEGDVLPSGAGLLSRERVREACAHAVETLILPALESEVARSQAEMIPVVLGLLRSEAEAEVDAFD